MQEYLLYAILIFIPVAALMEIFLRREGLVFRFRLILEIFSFAIIISFPVLISRLGFWYAFVIYLASIVALSWYFLRVSQGPTWYLSPAGISNSDEVFATERLIENNVVRTLGEIEDEMLLHNNQDSAFSDIDPQVPMNTEDLTADPEQIITDNISDPGQDETVHKNDDDEAAVMADDEPGPADHLFETAEVSAVEESNEPEFAAQENDLSAIIDEDPVDQEEVSAQTEPEEIIAALKPDDDLPAVANEGHEAASTEQLTAVPDQDINEGMPVKPEADNEENSLAAQTEEENNQAQIETVPAENDEISPATDQSESEVELEQTDLEVQETDSVLADQTANESESLVKQLSAEKNLDALIEHGFEMKQAQGYMEALQFFQAAAEITADEELKYLLTMETVDFHKQAGRYAQAEQVLFLSSIGQAYKRTDIIDKINRQLSYIRILSVELDRLGLTNTPIADVPREVTMSIAGILEL